ncbi:2-oxo acid dehydrogenase subunit E2 [Chloroflexi bacterium TSY]|nr:2-oxo acid dehydrogenase subunit E2 [Chloroflexi bacterium TSY]
MPTAIKMPQLGESVIEGTISRWLKAPGDQLDKLEPLLEISTDKIDTEIPAPDSGVLLQIVVEEGVTVEAGTTLGYIGAPGEAIGPEAETPNTESRSLTVPEKRTVTRRETTERRSVALDHETKPSGRDFISPVVARIAKEHNIDVTAISGSGLGGRVTQKDILAFLDQQPPALASQPELEIHEQQVASPLPSTQIASQESRPQEGEPDAPPTSNEYLQPLTTMRRAIAAHMVRSKATSPHVTTIFEADMAQVVQHREIHKSAYAAKGLRLTVTPYLVTAIVAGLQSVPEANGRFEDDGILINRRIHVGLAVALESGLVVPVIRDADEKNLSGLSRAVNDLSDRARRNKLSPDELQGGTFTLTNHGTGGSLIGTPIINQPQSGILGTGAIVKRPIVRSHSNSLLPSVDDAIVIRPMCYLSYTFDHRVLDGATADRFVTVVKETLENWS